MSIQEKFEKAVNVIRNLPKNGSYQPSHELQLRFYGYYKQATEGSNNHPKPSFWGVVKRAKWDAWARLGNMTKEEAMAHYVEELRKIVETMSYTDNVATFLNSLDNFYENVPAEDLELLVGPIIEKIRSRPNSPLSGSPLASRDASPTRVELLTQDTSPLRLNSKSVVHTNSPKHITSSLETSPASSYSASPLPPDTDDEEEEHFLDTQTEPDRGSGKKVRVDSCPSGDNAKEPVVKESLRFLTATNPGMGEKANAPETRVQSVPAVQCQEPDIGDSGRTISPSRSPFLGNAMRVTGFDEIDPTLHVPDPAQNTITTLQKSVEHVKSRLYSVENSMSEQAKQLTCITSFRVDQDNKTPSSDPFKRAIQNLIKEMEILQRRMSVLENPMQQEAQVAVGRWRSTSAIARWWGLPIQTTAVLMAWPILVLLISKWWSNRHRP